MAIKYFNPNNNRINLGQLIERLKDLSENGKNDKMRVLFNINDEEYDITNAWIMQDPDYNFDESNCGPIQWIELSFK